MDDFRMTALGHFKDWSNYLLVTSVASLGWVSTSSLGLEARVFEASIVCLTLSIILGMFTLAIIPVLAQNLGDSRTFYDVKIAVKPVLLLEWHLKIKWVCWPQHVFFMAGIMLYAHGVYNTGPPPLGIK